jgi:hypothetical protein
MAAPHAVFYVHKHLPVSMLWPLYREDDNEAENIAHSCITCKKSENWNDTGSSTIILSSSGRDALGHVVN